MSITFFPNDTEGKARGELPDSIEDGTIVSHGVADVNINRYGLRLKDRSLKGSAQAVPNAHSKGTLKKEVI